MAGPAAFVGRERELSCLLEVLGGDARLVLIVGDAGVGKTRFAEEGMARAAAAGMVMIRGECLPLAGTLPLLPVASALRELARLDGGKLMESALAAAPGYVRGEVARLLPGLGGGAVPDSRDGEWSRQRLFSAVAELLAAAGRAGSRVGLVAEDVHWADSATLDCLTVLAWAGRPGRVRVVVTCRGDEAPLAGHVAGWLAQARAAAGVEEIRLGPLSRAQTAEQVSALADGPVSPRVLDELYARAEGNPFFTEQLVAAALGDDTAGGGLAVPAGLPARLAELLAARAGRCAGDAQAVLAGLAVAGRPLGEGLLVQVTGLGAGAVRQGLLELAAARLLADDAPGGGHRPRHALLAEAVAGGLLPGERTALHERTARALALAGDPTLAAEVAGHWQAAGRPADELPARVAAAGAAEQVFGYAQAAAHWQRAIELGQAQPDAADAAGIDVPRLSVRAIDAFYHAGDSVRAGLAAEEAYRRFADHADPVIAAVVCHRAAVARAKDGPATGLPVMEEALRLFEQAPPSSDHANALLDYTTIFLLYAEERLQAGRTALDRALEIAEAAGATALIPRALSVIAFTAFVRGQVEEAFAVLERGWALARAARDGPALMWLAGNESGALLKLGQFQRAADVASRGLDDARQAGLQSWDLASRLAAHASEALLALGRTAEAAALIDPLTATPPDPDHWPAQVIRAEIDLLRGDTGAAARRWQLMETLPAITSRVDFGYDGAPRAAEALLWAGRPVDALRETRRALALFHVPDLTILCGRLLTAGMRACADLAGQARARRDPAAAEDAVAAADELVSWVGQMGSVPFTDHPTVAAIPAERATWDAERTRLTGDSDPAAWAAAAKTWDSLSCPHRAGYARWRQAQAQLDAGQPATAAASALRGAAVAADGHEPLLVQIRGLAQRARISLQPLAVTSVPPPVNPAVPYKLTGRELAVLRLLAAGRTNAQIGAELYISPRTAGVHVTNILRKLGVSGRVQAAAVAERAGLLETQRPLPSVGNLNTRQAQHCTADRSAPSRRDRILRYNAQRRELRGNHDGQGGHRSPPTGCRHHPDVRGTAGGQVREGGRLHSPAQAG
jgi:DNA-binding CsgD family transcriptional regulator/tetratricopeptide (TPR) repeat protein